MPQKVFRDPVHKHICFDKQKDRLLLDLISCKEVQRLRRLRQLGVSSFTYPGAEHSRFSHALGACHFMDEAFRAIEANQGTLNLTKRRFEHIRLLARAAALLHDIGHGPFSHLLEDHSGDHERRTCELIRSSKTEVGKVLATHSRSTVNVVASIVEGNKVDLLFVSELLSSQCDIDRMDFLLRDAHFCGVPFGQYDYDRILHSLRVKKLTWTKERHVVWLEKGMYAIEEYLFARFHMYWAVYFHKTTRGFEELLKKIILRASRIFQDNQALECSPLLKPFLAKREMALAEFTQVDDHLLLSHISEWINASDKILADLCNRFLSREGFKPCPVRHEDMLKTHHVIENARAFLVSKGLDPDYYFLESRRVHKAYDYYRPEKEAQEGTPKTSIYVNVANGDIKEISDLLKGVAALAQGPRENDFVYVPRRFWQKLSLILS